MENGVCHQSNAVSPGSIYGNGIYSDYVVPVQNQIGECISLAVENIALVPVKTTTVFTIADYGSADGGTSMELIYACVEKLKRTCNEEMRIHVTYEDTCDNDFRPLFQRLQGQVPGPKSYLKAFPNVYASACGTSFYDQCYPDGTVNFAFSAFAFHYLSKKPCDVTDGIHHTMITCPKEQETFREQAAKDWETILLNRATEMAPGARMVMVNLITDDKGSFLGSTEGIKNPLFVYWTNLWRTMLNEGFITKDEFQAMTIVNYYRTQEEWSEPFQSPDSPVHKAGLSLVHFENRTDRFDRYREPWLQQGDCGKEYAAWYTTMVRTWTQSTFYSALSNSRPEDDKKAITDEFYRRWRVDVEADPEHHGVDPIVYAFMVIEKKC